MIANRSSVLPIVFLLLAALAIPLSAQTQRYAAGDLIADPTGVTHTIVLVNAVSVLTADGLVILTTTDVGSVLPDPNDPTKTVTITSVRNNATTNRPEVLTFEELTSGGTVVRTVSVATDVSSSIPSLALIPAPGGPRSAIAGALPGDSTAFQDIRAGAAGAEGRNGFSLKTCLWLLGDQCPVVSVFPQAGDPGQAGPGINDTVGFAGGSIHTVSDNVPGIVVASAGGGGGTGGSNVSSTISVTSGGATAIAVGTGGSGGAGADGGNVAARISGGVTTEGRNADAVAVQSTGGDGGNGGVNATLTIAASVPDAGSLAIGIGGKGGRGGAGGSAQATIVGDVATSVAGSRAVMVESAGGAGGIGGQNVAVGIGLSQGAATAASIGIGGSGGAGGDSAGVTLVRDGVTSTSGANSTGVTAQSMAGGGGQGAADVSVAISYSPTAASAAGALGLGGSGGRGGASGNVDATITGDVTASGLGSDTLTGAGGVLRRLRTDGSNGVVAQSVAGGGGNGGNNVSAGLALGQLGSPLGVGAGGFGGSGGNAGTVALNVHAGSVSGIGDQRAAVVVQSVGGSGGNGGLDIAAGVSTGTSLRADWVRGFGGRGGFGGAGDSVTATVVADLSAAGTASRGLIAQSVGGDGGGGADNVSAAISGGATATALSLASGRGGIGGQGNSAGNVVVTQAGRVAVEGSGSIGVVAQSIGGGGGSGGMNVSGNLTSRDGLAVIYGLGGSGGAGANAGDVRLVSDGTVLVDGSAGSPGGVQANAGRTNFGDTANGILAQSVGGDGGTAGLNLSAAAFTGAASPIAVSIGGAGDRGGNAGSVTVERGTNSAASIQTSGDRANGLTAQSVGGAGSVGGASVNLVFGGTGGLAVSVGGTGGAGGNGAGVVVDNASGAIATRGANSTGLYAQSVGGKGGDGGIGASGNLPIRSITGAATGGPGGNGGSSGAVRMTNAGLIETIGNGASGLVARSLAGSGGNGGVSLATTGGASPGGGLTPLLLGGSGGAGGNAGDITASNAGQIVTAGANAHGIFAQSIGGSGGTAGLGLGVTGETTLTANTAPLFAALDGTNLNADQISGAIVSSAAAHGEARLTSVAGAEVTLAGAAGGGGDGGRIAIANTGSISTSGANAHGIFVQSLGGTVDAPAALLAAPNSGRGGDITVVQSGTITTAGAGSNGVFVQTLGGGYANGRALSGAGSGGNISVALSGSVQALAGDATGVLLESAGPGGAGNITLTLDRGGRIAGGTQATAVSVIGGRDNVFTNQGLVSSLAGAAGLAVLGTTGNDSVVNSASGVLTGSVDLGTGRNALTNLSGGVIESGAVISLGAGNLFTNAGTLSPGGRNTIQTTALTGNFAQTGAPTWNLDIGEPGLSDRLTVSGTAQLGNSSTEVNLREVTTPTQSGVYTLLSAASGVATGHFAFGSMDGAMPIGKTFELAQSDTGLQLSLQPSTGTFVWSGSVDNTWSGAFQRGTSNWGRPAGAFVFGTPGDATDVVIPGTGSSSTLGADFTINSLSVTGGGTPGASGAVVVGGNNTLTLAAHGGRGITLDPGAPDTTIAVPVILGSDQTWVNGSSNLLTVNGPSITGAGKNLTIDGTGNTLIGAAIQTGAGSLTKDGTGRLVLSGANTYGGATTLAAGTLQAGAANTFSVNSAATVGQGAVLDLNSFNQAIGSLAGTGDVTLGSAVLATGADNTSTTFGGTIAGSGGLVKTGSGTFTLAGVNTYSGGTLVSGGTLQGSTTSLQGGIVDQAEVRFDQPGNGTFGGTISGGGSVTKAGGGTVTFGANSYTGATTVIGGTLRASTAGAFGNSSATTVGGGATLDLNGFSQTLGSLSGAGLVTLGSAVLVTGGNDASTLFSGSISGSGGVAKTGAGIFTVTGPNSYSGGTLVDRGTLQGTSTSLQGSIVNNGAVVFDQASLGTYAGNMSGTGSLTKQNTGLLALTGTNSYSGGTIVSGGILQGNTSSLQGNIFNNASVVFDQAVAGEYNGQMSGTGSLTKQNTGLLVLNGSHTYSGPTTVAGGELFVGGSIGGGSVRVLNGAVLGGNGVVPAVTVEAGGILAPGGLAITSSLNGTARLAPGSIAEAESILTPALVGTLTVNGDLRLDPGSIYRVTAGRAGASLTQATGAVTVAGASIDVQAVSNERFHPITTFTIFRGQNGVTGTVSKPLASVSFLDPSLQLDSSGLTLTLRRNDVDFRSVGTSGNQTAVALSLNALVATATGPMADAINNVYDLSDQQALRAMGSMTGVAYQHVARSTIAGTQTFMNTTMTRLAQVASGTGEAVLATGADQSLMKTSGVWLSALGGSTQYSGNSVDPSASIPTRGLVVGYDAAVGSDFILGVSGSESSPEVQLDDASSLTTSRLLHLGVYGNYNRSNSRLGVMAGFGNWNNNTARDVTDGVAFAKAKAEYGGYGIFSHIEYGRLFAAGKSVIIEPQVGLQLTRVSLDGFKEDGAGALGLVVPDRQMVSSRTRLGVRATSTLPFGSAVHLMVEGRAAWAHEFSPLDSVTVRFAGDTATRGFDLEAPEFARDSALVGASVVGSTGRRLQFFASFGSEINRSITGWTGDAGVRAGW